MNIMEYLNFYPLVKNSEEGLLPVGTEQGSALHEKVEEGHKTNT